VNIIITRGKDSQTQQSKEQQQQDLEEQRAQLQQRQLFEQQRLQGAQQTKRQRSQTMQQQTEQRMIMNQTSDHFLPSPEVGMRIPEFTPANPELWFSIIDRSFQAAGIVVDATKFGYALAAIVPRYMTEIRDIIMNPPAECAYETLKTELIKCLSLSQEHKTRRLLEHEEIGDRKPSQFLRHLRGLAGSVIEDGMLLTVWLSRLPAYVQPHLVARTQDTLEQLADIADAIVEATRAQVTEVARPPVFRADLESATALEAKFNLQLVQLRVSLQQEMTEQLIGIRKLIEALGEGRSRRDCNRNKYRACSHSCDHGRAASGIPLAVRTGYPILRALLGTTARKRGGLMMTNEPDSFKKQLQVGYHIN